MNHTTATCPTCGPLGGQPAHELRDTVMGSLDVAALAVKALVRQGALGALQGEAILARLDDAEFILTDNEE
jgi:hypothetical protein